jgi:hypothetical protein
MKKTIAKMMILIIATLIIAGTFKASRWCMQVVENKKCQTIHQVTK